MHSPSPKLEGATPLLDVAPFAVMNEPKKRVRREQPVATPKKLVARPVLLPSREIAPHLLTEMWKAARQNQLFRNRRVVLPSGRICDDWNVCVRGLTDSYRTAREMEKSDARGVGFATRDKADLTALALVWSRSMLHGADLSAVRLVFPALENVQPRQTAAQEAIGEIFAPTPAPKTLHRSAPRAVHHAEAVADPDDTIQAKFEEFHRAHPEVYGKVVELAFTLKAQRDAGRCKWVSIGAIWERLRSDWLFAGRDSEGYKLNNNYRSRYARLLIADFPEFAGIIETRELQSK